MDQISLFEEKSEKNNVEIFRITPSDIKIDSDYLKDLKNLILANEDMYPEISQWLKEKVYTGIKDNQRVAYVAYNNSKPIISAVVKRDVVSKFCHLKIDEVFQDSNIGEMFFTLMSFEVNPFAQEIYFTLPESLWEKKYNFFKSFGFDFAKKYHTQYRKGEDELYSSAPFKKVWENVSMKLPKLKTIFNTGQFELQNDILLSLKPKYAEKVLAGEKKVEIRRVFNENLSGLRIAIYSSSPHKCIVGQAKISYIVKDHPLKIWQRYHNQIGTSFEEYQRYTYGKDKVYAILLDNVIPYKQDISLTHLSIVTKSELRPPQSFLNLKSNSNWSNALSIATLLQSKIKSRVITI